MTGCPIPATPLPVCNLGCKHPTPHIHGLGCLTEIGDIGPSTPQASWGLSRRCLEADLSRLVSDTNKREVSRHVPEDSEALGLDTTESVPSSVLQQRCDTLTSMSGNQALLVVRRQNDGGSRQRQVPDDRCVESSLDFNFVDPAYDHSRASSRR